MSEFLASYGLFLAELATLVVLVIAAFVLIAANRRGGHPHGLAVEHLNRRYEDSADALRRVITGKSRFKKETKARSKERKREEKARDKEAAQRPRLFVLDFKGDIRASAAASLREEVSAVLTVAADQDQVLLRLENPGGMVHEHGFAASQLLRIKRKGLRLLIAVDKVAASGGYLMACVADHLMAAPFAIVGSVGVLAQLPNFNRLLEQKGIDFEQLTAGRYKRTLTVFGKNTEECSRGSPRARTGRAARSSNRKSKRSTSSSRSRSRSTGRRSTWSASRRASIGTEFALSTSSSSTRFERATTSCSRPPRTAIFIT